MDALILFAHGARDPDWARPIRAVRDAILARHPAHIVELAFLEFMAPSLDEAIDGLAARGCRGVRIVPMFIAQGGHLKHDLPRMLDAARARHPGLALQLTGPVGEQPEVIAAMAEFAAAAE